ncbi:hypothetical protein [Arthrobacter sp. NPDC058127]|uniref:hypothetical protein n=1 Tax=Arthrobacter sp. NPDC058127 TaxID=3346351 RepID=UPI0036E0041B
MQETIYDEVVQKLADKVNQIRLGDPLDQPQYPRSWISPLYPPVATHAAPSGKVLEEYSASNPRASGLTASASSQLAMMTWL